MQSEERPRYQNLHEAEDSSSSDKSYNSDSDSDESFLGFSPVTSEEEYSLSGSSDESETGDTTDSDIEPPTTIQPPTMHLGLQDPGCDHQTTTQQTSTQCVTEPSSSGHTMYRLCGDNLDKTIKPRYMRSDTHKSESMHYFHSYAVADRIDFSDLSETAPPLPSVSLRQIATSLLPSPEDDLAIRNNLAVLVSRVLVSNLDFFKVAFDGVVDWHIKHDFYKQMSSKSEDVSIW